MQKIGFYSTISPGDGDTLEEAEPEEDKSTGGIIVKELEDVHSSLKHPVWVPLCGSEEFTCVHIRSPKRKERKQADAITTSGRYP